MFHGTSERSLMRRLDSLYPYASVTAFGTTTSAGLYLPSDLNLAAATAAAAAATAAAVRNKTTLV